ncbi:MAG: DUF2752 domain-containing protein [Bacteroidetes bacterium]|nr:DUF2752 domain-containing protein [Bacteroidota bacterium]
MGYSGIFSPDSGDYPVQCMHELITGSECTSCGLSHGFSLILRGRFSEAAEWNPGSMRIFLFFALQLLLRLALPVICHGLPGRRERNNLVLADSAVTIVMFLVAFFPLLRYQVFILKTLF